MMTDVKVFSTPGCAGCARTKQIVSELLVEFPELDWEEIDLTEQPELAGRYGIMSVPAVVINGRLEFTGVPSKEALRRKLRRIDSDRRQA